MDLVLPIADVDWHQTFSLLASGSKHLGPEIILIAVACFVLLLDLVVPAERSGSVLAWPSLLALIPAGWMVGRQLGAPDSEMAFFGSLAIDKLAAYFKLIVLIGTAFSIVLTHESRLFRDRRMGEFYALLLTAVAGMFFMVSATDLVLAFLAVELVSIPSFGLVA